MLLFIYCLCLSSGWRRIFRNNKLFTTCAYLEFVNILSCGVGLIFMVVGKTFPEIKRSCRYCLSRCISSPASCSPTLDSEAILVISTLESISAYVELSREAVMPGYISEGVSLNTLQCSLWSPCSSVWLYTERGRGNADIMIKIENLTKSYRTQRVDIMCLRI